MLDKPLMITTEGDCFDFTLVANQVLGTNLVLSNASADALAYHSNLAPEIIDLDMTEMLSLYSIQYTVKAKNILLIFYPIDFFKNSENTNAILRHSFLYYRLMEKFPYLVMIETNFSEVDLFSTQQHLINANALSYAVINGNTAIIEKLIHCREVGPNARSSNHLHPCYIAFSSNQMDALRYLHHLGGDINISSHLGYTLMHLAVIKDWADRLQVLIELGANLHIRNHEDLTPLQLAEKNKHSATYQLLKKFDKSSLPSLTEIGLFSHISDENTHAAQTQITLKNLPY